MALLDWSTSLIGYPAHRRSGVPVLGVSHCTVHDALRFAESLAWFTGWVRADAAAAHLVGLPGGLSAWSVLAECFVERRIVHTEGPVGGCLTFVPAVQADGRPPVDRGLIDWVEGRGRPWLEVIDNEMAYWGGLDQAQQRALLTWFCDRRPLPYGAGHAVDPVAAEALLAESFRSGLSRNGALVEEARQQLWAGVHEHCMLDRAGYPFPSELDLGYQLVLQAGRWCLEPLEGACPIDDQRGRVAAHGERA
jgi:hypothetical protein